MRNRLTLTAVAATTALAAIVPATSIARDDDGDRVSDGPHFEGKVVRVDRANDRFRIRDLERGSHRVYVTSKTRYERVNGLRGLRRGMEIEVGLRRSGGRWIATEVERERADDRDRDRNDDD